jgi:hypothetical protein
VLAGAGPLRITYRVPAGPLGDLIGATLSLYDVAWPDAHREVELACRVDDAPLAGARGDYLEAAQMLVDTTPAGLRATTTRGGNLDGTFGDAGESWSMGISSQIIAAEAWSDVEDLLSLVLTTGWRRAGWVPLHAAGLSDGSRGVIVCATGGGGKTTFTIGMARRGWRVLGDDKLLLDMHCGSGRVRAVKHMMNVDPVVRRWFDEVGDLSRLPSYSSWTGKRRVALGSLWPAAPATAMSPTHLLAIDRRADARGISVSEMSTAEAISALLHQSVIPREPQVARLITGALATTAQRLTPRRVTIGDGAYAEPDALAVVEAALR